jgi:hypothetical protein
MPSALSTDVADSHAAAAALTHFVRLSSRGVLSHAENWLKEHLVPDAPQRFSADAKRRPVEDGSTPKAVRSSGRRRDDRLRCEARRDQVQGCLP